MRVEIHWLFLLILITASLAGYHLEALILLGSLIAHEIAHLMVAWVLGLGVEELTLTPFGGMARLDTTLETDPQAETSVALAGPFQSFFLAGTAGFLMGDELFDQAKVRFFFEVNANLAFFNLIPALPLDGGRALRGLLAQRFGYRRVTGWMFWLGRLSGVLMVAAAMIVLVTTGSFYITPIVGGLFLVLGAGGEVDDAVYRSYRQFLHKRERLAGRRVMRADQLVAVEGTRIGEVLEHMSGGKYHLVLVVDRSLRPIGTLHEAELIDAFQEIGPNMTVEQVLDM